MRRSHGSGPIGRNVGDGTGKVKFMVNSGLHVIDYGVLAVYLATVLFLGSILGKKQKDTKDYFLAGRSMHWLPMGISIFASLASAASFVGAPAEVFKYDMKMGVNTFA